MWTTSRRRIPRWPVFGSAAPGHRVLSSRRRAARARGRCRQRAGDHRRAERHRGAARRGRVARQAAWTGDPAPTAEWAWLRCARPVGNCAAIPDTAGEPYRVRAEDLGKVLRVRVRVSNSSGTARGARSRPASSCGLPPTPVPTATRAGGDPRPTRHADRDPRADARGPGGLRLRGAPVPSVATPIVEPVTPAAPRPFDRSRSCGSRAC